MSDPTPSTPWDPITTHRQTIESDTSAEIQVGAKPLNRGSRVFLRALGRSYTEMTPDEARSIGNALIAAAEAGEKTWPESVFPPLAPEPGSPAWRVKRKAARATRGVKK